MPFFSIIVLATDEHAHLLPRTLDSIFLQNYPNFEVILIDGQKKENPILCTKAHKFAFAENLNIFSMMNQGASLAQGEYLHFLHSGEFYLSCHSLVSIAQWIRSNPAVDLIQTGCILHHSRAPTQTLFEPLSKEGIKKGKIPLNLQAFWFRKKTLERQGKFRTFYTSQGGFELLCRLVLDPSVQKTFIRRVLTDYEYSHLSSLRLLRQFFENLFILGLHLGVNQALFWWMVQSYRRFFYWSWEGLKSAFWKRRPVH
jgi:glycosyltransferase involved in cell wall biosynthesis